jgi:hypothetical protein
MTIRANLTRHSRSPWQNGRIGPVVRSPWLRETGRVVATGLPTFVVGSAHRQGVAVRVPVTVYGWLTGRDTVFGVVARWYAACAAATCRS